MYWFYILLILYYIIGVFSYIFLHIKNNKQTSDVINYESIKVNNSLSQTEL